MKETIEKKEPNFEGYQMIGDSQLRRFGEKIMNLRGEYREKGGKRINLCIGGQTIEQLTRELKHANNLEKQLIVMIGTNDLLRDKEVKNICNDYDKLVEVLLEKADKIILVTIPPIPKLGENDRWQSFKQTRGPYQKDTASFGQILSKMATNAIRSKMAQQRGTLKKMAHNNMGRQQH
ncbi:hypothetical protein J6590_100614 [Homalodisca vitripennis]|nr:hypothetical protein J6590_100614 [Homalodisca vitripennis]